MYAADADADFAPTAAVLTLAELLPGAVRETLDFVDRLDQAATRLEGHTCTGAPYWRDKDRPGKAPKLYVIHRTDRFCPLHGKPAARQRLRTYIGCAAPKQAHILEAIAAESRRRYLLTKRDDLSRKLAAVEATLLRLLLELGCAPETASDPAPTRDHTRSFTVEELLRL